MASPLRWAAVILPVALIGLVEAVVDRYLDGVLPSPFDVLVVPAIVLVLASVFAAYAFRRVDRLTLRLREHAAELERTNESLHALRRVGVKVAGVAELVPVLQAIVDEARGLLTADVAFISLVHTDGDRITASSGELSASDDASVRTPPEPHRGVGTARLSAPLQNGGATMGSLVVIRAAAFDREDFEVLSALASQAALALEKDRLQRELRELAVRGERERIAREMHDGLAQVLGYVNTKAQAAAELLAAGSPELARRQLDELSSAARSVYVDIREAILGLSSPIPPEGGLVGALEAYALRFSEASKLAAHVAATGAAARCELTPESQAQLFRVVQEALTNVRKHAAARRVEVSLDVTDAALVVEVRDDGKGFDARQAPADGWPRFGMQAIRERAASVGAEVTWVSVPHAGTTLRIALPLPRAPVVPR